MSKKQKTIYEQKIDSTNELKDDTETNNKIEKNEDDTNERNKPKENIEKKANISSNEMKIEKNVSINLEIGMKVKLKENSVSVTSGKRFPHYAYRNIYKVIKVLPRRIIIKCDNIELAVDKKYLEVI